MSAAPTEPVIPQHHTYLTRLRGNAAQALHDHANLVDLQLALLLVVRGRARATEVDVEDAVTLAEQMHALTEIRKGGTS